MTKFHTYRMADVSTWHITRRDRELILDPEMPNLWGIRKDGSGTLFYTVDVDDELEFLKLQGLSDAFMSIFKDAADQGIEYIKFHACGTVYPGLTKYEE